MIASLLPGLRDLRTPLATGYLWLIALWLLLQDRLPKSLDEATGPIRSLYELGGFLGATAVLAALSFVAYLLGSMLLFNPQPAISGIGLQPVLERRRENRLKRWAGDTWIVPITMIGRTQIHSMFNQLETFVTTRLRETAQSLDEDNHSRVLRNDEASKELHSIVQDGEYHPDLVLPSLYINEITRDLPAVGIQLQAKNRDLWDTYDRQTAEAQFRFGITPPIALIIVLLASQSGNLWWLLLLAVPVFLLALAVRQSLRATSSLVQAVILKIVEPPVLERLREEVARVREQIELERERRAQREAEARQQEAEWIEQEEAEARAAQQKEQGDRLQ